MPRRAPDAPNPSVSGAAPADNAAAFPSPPPTATTREAILAWYTKLKAPQHAVMTRPIHNMVLGVTRGDRDKAQEIVQDTLLALVTFLTTGEGWVWDWTKVPFRAWLIVTARGLLANEQRLAYSRYRADDRKIARTAADDGNDPYSVVHARQKEEREERRVAEVERRLNPLARKVYESMRNDEYDPAALAAAEGVPAGQIYDARDRVTRQIRKVFDEMPDSSDRRPATPSTSSESRSEGEAEGQEGER
jgi:DNA-directed RNA polymerase specialized sigma24 family protein